MPDRGALRRDVRHRPIAHALDIDEYEQAHDLEPGLDRIAEHLVDELGKLRRGEPHALSRTLLDGNPAWPAELAAPRGGRSLTIR